MNIAFFTAHPDDHEMMLAYGIVDAIREHGADHVYAYIATDGKASTLGDPTFVQAGRRRDESRAGLTALGLQPDRLHYPDLPDGQLSDPKVATRLAADIHDFIATHHITTAYTLGPDGGDGHPDHIAVHQAVAAARPPKLLALNAAHTGPHTHRGPRQTKLQALAAHHSQFPDVTNLPGLYHPYLETETYDAS